MSVWSNVTQLNLITESSLDSYTRHTKYDSKVWQTIGKYIFKHDLKKLYCVGRGRINLCNNPKNLYTELFHS